MNALSVARERSVSNGCHLHRTLQSIFAERDEQGLGLASASSTKIEAPEPSAYLCAPPEALPQAATRLGDSKLE